MSLDTRHAVQAKYYNSHKDSRLAYCKSYYDRNKERLKVKRMERYYLNKVINTPTQSEPTTA